MLMFELIWVERGLAFEVEGNICKSLEPRKDVAILKDANVLVRQIKRVWGLMGGVDDKG